MKTGNDYAEGGDTRDKGASETLAMLLYRSFEAGNKEKVVEATRCGENILETPANS